MVHDVAVKGYVNGSTPLHFCHWGAGFVCGSGQATSIASNEGEHSSSCRLREWRRGMAS